MHLLRPHLRKPTKPKDLLKKTQDKDAHEIKPLTVCYWSDFMANPAIMYGLFSSNPRKLQYDPDKVKVMGTKEGMINQINITSVEDLESFCEQIIGVPLLMRIWAEFFKNDYVGAVQPDVIFENDLALLIDTSHPMIRPELERALDQARKIIQSRGKFCIQINFGPAIDRWIKAYYPTGYCSMCRLKSHRARLYITNYDKQLHVFECNALWCMVLWSCWLFSAPCYKMYRYLKCTDIIININAPVVRRAILAISDKVIEVTR